MEKRPEASPSPIKIGQCNIFEMYGGVRRLAIPKEVFDRIPRMSGSEGFSRESTLLDFFQEAFQSGKPIWHQMSSQDYLVELPGEAEEEKIKTFVDLLEQSGRRT